MTIGPAPMIRMLLRSVRFGISALARYESIDAGGGQLHAEADEGGAGAAGEGGAGAAPAAERRGQAGAAEDQRAEVEEAERLGDAAEDGEGQRLVGVARVD